MNLITQITQWLREQPGTETEALADEIVRQYALAGYKQCREALLWQEIRNYVHRIDQERRGPGPGMNDDDIFDIVMKLLHRQAKKSEEGQ